MLDELFEMAHSEGAGDVVIGMAHRGGSASSPTTSAAGRLDAGGVRGREGDRGGQGRGAIPTGGTGDVKYHYGHRGSFTTRDGAEVGVRLYPNPSHLGSRRDRRRPSGADERSNSTIEHDPVAVPVLLHGDAAFPAQGVVAETLNLQSLAGYATGGTIHIIQNNQIGFTTEPQEARSTPYAADMAKGFNVPIIHVNADDPEACVAAIRLAMAYRGALGRDVVIDLIGYRRFGHNETDEPAYTQPMMAAKIKEHPPVSSSTPRRW